MSENELIYSIQQTYTIKPVSKLEKRILTCEQRIDIPTIEPYSVTKAVVYSDKFLKIIPCIELAGSFLDGYKFSFETNEGVTVLPIKLYPGMSEPLDNPYMSFRYVLVLPQGATGVKSCNIIHKSTGKEVQHNFTFGIMPPPYNYDNALFGCISYRADTNHVKIKELTGKVADLENKTDNLKLTKETLSFPPIELQKGSGKEPIMITYDDGKLFYETVFNYPFSSEPTIHNPKITFRGGGRDYVYTLSLSRTTSKVIIDLFTGMITVYNGFTGEIMQQFKLALGSIHFVSFSFENFDDIVDPTLLVTPWGVKVS